MKGCSKALLGTVLGLAAGWLLQAWDRDTLSHSPAPPGGSGAASDPPATPTPPAAHTPLPPGPPSPTGDGVQLDSANASLVAHLQRGTLNNTLFVTSGNYGFRHFLKNVEETTHRAYPGVRLAAVMLDAKSLQWCHGEMHRSDCLSFQCSCPYATHAQGNFSAEGYTSCLLGIYICKLRIKLAVLQMGFNVFFIDGDAALRPGALNFLEWGQPMDVVGACEACSGSCKLSSQLTKVIDLGAHLPAEHYKQVNIGLFWVNATDVSKRGLTEAIKVIVDNRIDIKSVDQTVVNRRWMALGARMRCLSTQEGGLNVRSRSTKPRAFPNAWGVHAARLVSKTGFYKQAFLYVNDLWTLNVSHSFAEDVALWKSHPSSLKKRLRAKGEI